MANKFKYGITLVELVKALSARKGQSFFVEGLGDAIQLGELTTSQAKEAMQVLASKSNGKIPATNGDFYTALIDEKATPNWIDASSFVLVESSKDVVTGLAKGGEKILDATEGLLDSTISIARNLDWLIPLIAVGTIFIYVGLMPKGKL